MYAFTSYESILKVEIRLISLKSLLVCELLARVGNVEGGFLFSVYLITVTVWIYFIRVHIRSNTNTDVTIT